MSEKEFLLIEGNTKTRVYTVPASYFDKSVEEEIESLIKVLKEVIDVYCFLKNGCPIVVVERKYGFVVYGKKAGGKKGVDGWEIWNNVKVNAWD